MNTFLIIFGYIALIVIIIVSLIFVENKVSKKESDESSKEFDDFI